VVVQSSWRRSLIAAIAVLGLVIASLLTDVAASSAAGNGVISGTVFIESNDTPAGSGEVTVVIRAYDSTVRDWGPALSSTPTSDAGAFSFGGLSPGGYRLEIAGSPGAYPETVTQASISTEGQTVSAYLTVRHYRTLSGVVLMPDGTPAPAGSVRMGLQVNWVTPPPIPPPVLIGPGGAFSFTGLVAADYEVFYEYLPDDSIFDDADGSRYRTVLRVGLGSKTDAILQLNHAYAIRGHVSLGSTARAAGAGEVEVKLTTYCCQTWQGITDANGDFVVRGLPQGTYSAEFRQVDGAGQFTTVTVSGIRSFDSADPAPVDVVLRAETIAFTEISGTVTAGGDPAEHAYVSIDRYAPDSLEYLDTTVVSANSFGKYVARVPGGGVFVVIFRATDPDYPWTPYGSVAWERRSAYTVPDLLTLDAGAYVRGIDADLPVAASISGLISGPGIDSADFSGNITLAVEYFDEEFDDWVSPGAHSEPWSSYEVNDLVPGTYRLTVIYEGDDGIAAVRSPSFDLSADEHVVWNAVLPVPQPFVTVFRFWSQNNQSHFYTASVDEAQFIIDNYSEVEWRFEGAVYTAFSSPSPGTVPLYRFWSQRYQGHFYTTNEAEKNAVIAAYDDSEWAFEGTAFYVYPADSAVSNSLAVARFWSQQNRHHFYTADAAEASFVKTHYPPQQWAYEGDDFRVPGDILAEQFAVSPECLVTDPEGSSPECSSARVDIAEALVRDGAAGER